MIIRQYGLIGSVRIVVDQVCVAEQKPFQVKTTDLRANEPFPELIEFCNSIDMDKLEFIKHSHTPWIVVLLKAADAWKKEKGDLPKNFQGKKEFKTFIKSMAQDASKEINFDEAVANSSELFKPTTLSDSVQQIFSSEKLGSDIFWVACATIKDFYDKNKTLPLAGAVPDMTSTPEMYLAMQRVYHEKAKADLAECVEILKTKPMPDGVTLEAAIDQLAICCKNSKYMEITSIRTLAEEEASPPEELEWELDDSESAAPWYLAVRAAEDFRTKFGHYPGMDENGGYEPNLVE